MGEEGLMSGQEAAIAVFLAGYPPEIAAICQQLRALVARVAPDAREVLVARQNHIAYAVSDRLSARIAYICPLRAWVRLGFYYGGALDDLPDAAGLLEGEGKRLRHVKVRTLAQAEAPALAWLLAAGWAAGAAALA
ncbi:MAG TPA: hypothetical protein VFX31_07355, partial [Ktedonobacterales bacterium]|nr:hypothetical protein [Ktedonobacterales bacterium]